MDPKEKDFWEDYTTYKKDFKSQGKSSIYHLLMEEMTTSTETEPDHSTVKSSSVSMSDKESQ